MVLKFMYLFQVPILEKNKKELVETTGNEYLKNKEILNQLSKIEINREKKCYI